jgi:hypothetical protein
MMMMGESVYNGQLSRCILCCLRFWFCECIAGSVCAARLCALLVLVLILVLRRWEAGGVSGSAFRVLAVAAALCCLSVCGGLSNAVGCRGRAADEAERVGFAQQEGWGPIRSLGYGCTSEA